jgi:hypothetical protein
MENGKAKPNQGAAEAGQTGAQRAALLQKRRRASGGVAAVAEIDEMDDGEFVERNSLLGADGLQRIVDVRQVVERDVADTGVDDFVFAHAAMEPAEEERELHGDWQQRGEQAG